MNRGDDCKAFKISSSTQKFEPSNKTWKNKKKKHHTDKKDSKKPKDSTILATGVNAAEVKNQNRKRKKKKDINEITCYNCTLQSPVFGALEAKKQVSVLVTCTSMIGLRKKTQKRLHCIDYLVLFNKDIVEVQTLIDSESEVNAMTSIFTKKLGLRLWKTNIEAQKIDRSTFETYSIVITGF